ncbi:hypothetical protein EDD17DRAFT_1776905 [Pisolithus thermaeus]|nr:hypothetical protein EDD17DRAFT_1776905 [Pisolithus thermaeus]
MSSIFSQPFRSYGVKASYATIRSLRQPLPKSADIDELDPSDNDFILSILRANPSLRDTKSYLASFGHQAERAKPSDLLDISTVLPPTDRQENELPKLTADPLKTSPVISSILNPIYRRTALRNGFSRETGLETMRVVSVLEAHGAKARPVLGTVVRLGPMPCDYQDRAVHDVPSPEAHVFPTDLVPIRSSLRAGEIPVLPPFALDSFCRSVRIDANDVIAALVRGMVRANELDDGLQSKQPCDPHADYSEDINLVPLRLMIINREGGVPSYAASGYPHLLINLSSEYDFIRDTFEPSWLKERPSALSNLRLARTCLSYMPPASSAIMVSHRSPSSLIANLITNKPAVSSSLPHALLQGNRKLAPETPTLIRRGQPIQVIRSLAHVDRAKLTHLLETSVPPISYLDKFAVLPSHQGDGTVDFLWVALHDETYWSGTSEGKGEGRDLVWRSRADNKVNKWYFDRSSGHMRMGSWVLFWCDAEKRLKQEESQRADSGLSYIENWEAGRLEQWADVVTKIPSVWK